MVMATPSVLFKRAQLSDNWNTYSSLCYQLPTLISVAIWDAKNYPEIYEVFPSLYDKDKIEEEKRSRKRCDLSVVKF